MLGKKRFVALFFCIVCLFIVLSWICIELNIVSTLEIKNISPGISENLKNPYEKRSKK